MTSTRAIRVGFDGRGFSSPAAGIRRYSRELVEGLLALGEPLDMVALGGHRDQIPAGVAYEPEPWHPPTNAGWTLVGLPHAASRARVDLIHAPAYTAPFWAGAPVVVTIHDVSYEMHPEWYPYRRDWLRRAFYRHSAVSASRVLTVSAFSASEIVAAYGVPRERIGVTPLGVRPSFGDREGSPIASEVTAGMTAGVREPFVLHVGDLHVRRNLSMLLEAVLHARHALGPAAPALVLAGVDRGVGDDLRAAAERAGDGAALVLLGVVGDDQLGLLYRRATALVYPSLYEGFGLPLLEAMACGTPVLGSTAASIPEVLGDAGLLLDPLDVSAWRDALVRVTTDDALGRALRARGRARAATYTWARTARLTYDAYLQVTRAA